MDIQDEGLVRMLSAATQLPLTLYHRNRAVFCLPADPPSAGRLLRGEDPLETIHVSPGQMHMPQYVTSRYGERYLYFQMDPDRALLMGALSDAGQARRDVYQLLRTLRLPVGLHGRLKAHFDSLQVVDDSRYFYLGRLLEAMFRQSPGGAKRALPKREEGVERTFAHNAYANRIGLFSHPPYFLEQEIVRHITAGDEQSALRILSEINSLSRATLARDPLRSLKNSLICSCTLFTRAAIAGGVSADEAFTLSDSFIQVIELSEELRALDGLEEQMVLGFIGQVAGRLSEQYGAVTRSAIRYIDDHLTESLALEDIAGAVFVHPNYLSQRFHRDTGITLNAFIQKRRIAEAKYFIRHTNSPISDIAHFYGFCSQSYFIQVFKRETGLTPKQFRREEA